MKKIVLISLLATVFGNMAFAQKTTYKCKKYRPVCLMYSPTLT